MIEQRPRTLDHPNYWVTPEYRSSTCVTLQRHEYWEKGGFD